MKKKYEYILNSPQIVTYIRFEDFNRKSKTKS